MSKGKLLAVSFVWLLILAVGVVTWKTLFAPVVQQSQAEKERAEAEERRQQREAELRRGGSDSHYRTQVRLALDAFSGYCVLRSPEFAGDLRDAGIKLDLVDDQADYGARLAALKDGETDMAVFTIDALVKTSAEINSLPATIVGIIDETVGADAVVAYKQTIPNVGALNNPDTKFVLTPDSPSETLARVVIARFQLDELSDDPFIRVQDAAEVVEYYKKSRPTDRYAYVLWEPYVTQVLQNERMQVVVDSSRFPSAIVDVIVASDDMIAKNRDAVEQVLKSYAKANYAYREPPSRIELVMKDASMTGTQLTRAEATRLVEGIWWKNTQENLLHMGARSGQQIPHIEDMIAGVTKVLLESGSISADPTAGHPNYLYNDSIWRELSDFHPGASNEEIRGRKLPQLTEDQWNSLVEVGTARAPTLVFARGTDRLTERSQSLLDELARTLETTRYYIVVRGNASRRGDMEANKRLAESRAVAVESYLTGRGIDADRIRAFGVEPGGSTSVTFVLGELPY